MARKVLSRTLALVLGTGVGFFGSFNSVFSDGGTTERVTAILLTSLAVGAVSALVSVIEHSGRWVIALWVWAPGAFILLTYVVLGEYSAWIWCLFVGAVTLGAAVAGALLGGSRSRSETVR